MRVMNQNEKAYITAMNGLCFSNSSKSRMIENLRNMCASGLANAEADEYYEKPVIHKRRLSGSLVAVAAIIAVLTVTVLAVGIVQMVVGYNGKLGVSWGEDDEGNPITQAFAYPYEMDIFELRDNSVWFIANDEEIEITSEISREQAWVYSYSDDSNITHYLVVGGAPENPGWGEFLRDADGDWIAGVIHDPESGSGGIMIYSGSDENLPPDDIEYGPRVSCAWYANLCEELGIPY